MVRKIAKSDYLKIKKNILKKLYSNQAFSKGHLLIERLMCGIPPHLHGHVKSIIGDLMKNDLVLFYGKTKYGNAYQLNIKKISEIEKIIF